MEREASVLGRNCVCQRTGNRQLLRALNTPKPEPPSPGHQGSGLNRVFRVIFLFLAALLVLYAGLFANYLHAIGSNIFVWAMNAKLFWLPLIAGLFLALAAWRFPARVDAKIFLVIFGFAVAELLLQLAAGLGVLPDVNTKFKAPFARVYWTAEGHGNDIRNRYGWHTPAFDLNAPKRVAIIGDSLVEAVEVGRNQNASADLERLLRAKSADWSVLGLGNHGTSPAYYLDVFDYAERHFSPQEVVVMISLVNDINESSPALNYLSPRDYIYYDLDSDGRLVLNPASAGVRAEFDRGLEFSHQPFLVTLPVTLQSHCMLLQLEISLLAKIKRRSNLPEIAAADPEAAKYGRIGLSLKPYELAPGPEAQHSMTVMLAELAQLKQKCDAQGVKLRLVTMPFFPPPFYATQHGAAWSLKLADKYDFLAPDKQIAAFADSRGIPFLSIAEWLQAKKISAEEIHTFYFTEGSGHLTERGHAICSEAIFDAFYSKPPP